MSIINVKHCKSAQEQDKRQVLHNRLIIDPEPLFFFIALLFHSTYFFSAILSFALLDRGFFFISSLAGSIGFLLITRSGETLFLFSKGLSSSSVSKVPFLKKFFTSLSSSE